METRVEQETDYENEEREIRVVFEGESFSALEETFESESSKEHEISEQRYVVEAGGFYLMGQDKSDMNPDMSLALNSEQEQAVQVALAGGIIKVEVLTPFGTDEVDVWSIQTFSVGEPTPDGKPTFVLSAMSEERPKLTEEPEEARDAPSSGYTSFESIDGAISDYLPVQALEISVQKDTAVSYSRLEQQDLDSSGGVERTTVQPQKTVLVEEALTEVMAIFELPVEEAAEIEQIAPIATWAERSSENDIFETAPVVAMEVEKTEVVLGVAELDDIAVEPECVDAEVRQGIALAESERSPNKAQTADLSEFRAVPTESSTRESHVEAGSPVALQINKIIYLRRESPMPVQVLDSTSSRVKESTVESPQHIKPVLPVMREEKLEQAQGDRQDVRPLIREDAAERQDDVSLHDTALEITRVVMQQSKSENVKAAGVGTLERAVLQHKKTAIREVQASSWEKSDRVGLSGSRASRIGPVVDEDDIVVSFEASRSLRHMRRVRARSMAA